MPQIVWNHTAPRAAVGPPHWNVVDGDAAWSAGDVPGHLLASASGVARTGGPYQGGGDLLIAQEWDFEVRAEAGEPPAPWTLWVEARTRFNLEMTAHAGMVVYLRRAPLAPVPIPVLRADGHQVGTDVSLSHHALVLGSSGVVLAETWSPPPPVLVAGGNGLSVADPGETKAAERGGVAASVIATAPVQPGEVYTLRMIVGVRVYSVVLRRASWIPWIKREEGALGVAVVDVGAMDPPMDNHGTVAPGFQTYLWF